MPIPTQYAELLKSLTAKSKEGKVEWRESTSKGSFYLAFSRFALEIYSGNDNQTDRGFISVSLRNEKGDNIDHFWVDDGTAEYRALEELYALALRKARKIDVALAELEAELNLDTPGSANDSRPPHER